MQLRNKLSKYKELFFCLFIFPVFGLMSIGQGSDYLLYRIVFPIAFACLIIKFFVTDYTKKEWIWLCIVGGLLILNFLLNREKTLLLTFMAIAGAKNVDLDKIVKWALWERVVLTATTVTLALTGIVNNELVEAMPKYIMGHWENRNIYCYGYAHPNHAFLDLFTIAILIILVYHEKIKWYGYVVLMGMMYVGYYFLVCRTGWFIWILAFAMFIVYELIKRTKIRKWYLYLVSMAPIVVMAFSVFGLVLYHAQQLDSKSLWYHIDVLFTGRFKLALECYPAIFTQILGHIPRMGRDLGYIHLIYNYGWIIVIIGMIAYISTMWIAIEQEKDYLCIALAVMSGYLIGEVTPLNVGWNILWIYLAMVLFKKDKGHLAIKEMLQTSAPWLYKIMQQLKHQMIVFQFRERTTSFGKQNKDRTFFLIRNMDYKTGLMSYFNTVMGWTIYALEKGYIPVVDMKNYTNTYLDNDNLKKENAWEYYFEQPGRISLTEVYQSKKVILNSGKSNEYADPRHLYYDIFEDSEEAYKLYKIINNTLALNKEMQESVVKTYQQIFPSKGRSVGVVCRGTDLIQCKKHSVQPTVSELVDIVRNQVQKWDIDIIFLASDTDEAVQAFKKAFPGKVFVNDCKRFDHYKTYNGNTNSLGDVCFQRKNDAYLRGKEYLITLQLLAKCDYLIGTLVGATVGAIGFNGGQYIDKYIIDRGVY